MSNLNTSVNMSSLHADTPTPAMCVADNARHYIRQTIRDRLGPMRVEVQAMLAIVADATDTSASTVRRAMSRGDPSGQRISAIATFLKLDEADTLNLLRANVYLCTSLGQRMSLPVPDAGAVDVIAAVHAAMGVDPYTLEVWMDPQAAESKLSVVCGQLHDAPPFQEWLRDEGIS